MTVCCHGYIFTLVQRTIDVITNMQITNSVVCNTNKGSRYTQIKLILVGEYAFARTVFHVTCESCLRVAISITLTVCYCSRNNLKYVISAYKSRRLSLQCDSVSASCWHLYCFCCCFKFIVRFCRCIAWRSTATSLK